MSIVDVIKYEGDNTTFIWKHPCEDFNYGSQLIVHESQEAVFFKNGEALDSFGPGRYTLSTENLPLIRRVIASLTGGESPFHCEVYFINKVEQMAIKWGTDTKMEYVEPTYSFPIQLGACGEMSVRVDNPRQLLVKIVGTETSFTQASLMQKFRAFLMIHLKPYVVSLIKENKINIFEIDEHLQEISTALFQSLTPDFLGYGLALERFLVTTVVKPEDDKNYRRFKELHFRQYADIAEAKLRQQVGVIDQQTAAQRMVIEAQGLAQKRSLEGYTYQDERGFDVAERVASNQAVGQFTNMGVGLGMISGIGGGVGTHVGGLMQNALNGAIQGQQPAQPAPASTPTELSGTKCAKCGADLPANAKFCLECGEKVAVDDGKIACPQCGARVPTGKFCLECGASLVPTASVCPKCGKEVQTGAKFCLECGEKLN